LLPGAPAAAQSVTFNAPPWLPTGGMANGRSHHTATLLPNGKVLVVGGTYDTDSRATASAELFDPTTGTWSPTGSMEFGREDHTATLLPNGKVLVAGGWNESVSGFAAAELYDPATGHFVYTGSMSRSHLMHTATLLPNGKVLVAGGQSDGSIAIATSELYDPSTGRWSVTNPMHGPRSSHQAVALANGQVLIAGGTSGGLNFPTGTQTYDPTNGTWSDAGPMSAPRMFFTLTVFNTPASKPIGSATPAAPCITIVCAGGLPGPVLAAGGWGPTQGWLASADVFDLSTRTWHATGNMLHQRADHTAALLPNGKVLIAGGSTQIADNINSEVFDPVFNTFGSSAPMNGGRNFPTATLLRNGTVLVAGGAPLGGNATQSAEIYTPPNIQTLQTSVTGGAGKVTSNPAGISCGFRLLQCTANFTTGVQVTLTAVGVIDPSGNEFDFDHWEGDCASAGAFPRCTLTMNGSHRAVAVMVKGGSEPPGL
jgi:hypothetical protein